MQHPFWKWFWRGVAAVAVVFMVITTLLFWTAWRSSAFRAAANGKTLEVGVDVIALQLDILSLIIAVVAIGLGVAGFVGYQSIREGAMRKAQDAAEREVGIVAPPLIRREVADYVRTFRGELPISDSDVDAMVAAAGLEGGQVNDGR